MLKRLTLILSLAAGFAVAGDMLVEEPGNLSSPPIDPDKDAAGWSNGGHSQPLTARDQQAINERRKRVEEMAERIREKREALEQSGGEEKKRRSRELKDLILEGDKDLNKKEDLSEKQVQKKEEIREKRLEKEREKADRQVGSHGGDSHGKGPQKKSE